MISDFGNGDSAREAIDRDFKKSKNLLDAGWHVIRVRERPLKKITIDDIVFRFNDIKQAVNKLLYKIEASYNLELPHLQRYLKRKMLINKKAADAYIEKLLSEKLSE